MPGAKAIAAIAVTLVFVFSIGRPNYPGGLFSFTVFGAAAVGLVVAALIWKPSVFAVTMPMFLTLGFFLKFVAHNTFGVPLIEPVGAFDGSPAQWDAALDTASAGLTGCMLGIVCIRRTSSLAVAGRAQGIPAAAKPYLRSAALFLFVAAFAIYYLNMRWNILRIGYPMAIDLPFPLYPLLAFVITWGALLGAAAICCWLSEIGSSPNVDIIYAAGALGFAASLTMGSRVQFLLYILAAVIIVGRKSGVHALLRARTLTALCVCGFLFCLSIGVVSLQRSSDFLSPSGSILSSDRMKRPDLSTNTDMTKADGSERAEPSHGSNSSGDVDRRPSNAPPVAMEYRASTIAQELKSLVIMRWVGLEGVMTTAASTDRLGYKLLATSLLENPARGTDGLYQHLAGDKYLSVKNFTFLTLPGPIGVASYSGDVLGVGLFMFLLVLMGHGLEVFSAYVTRNAGCTVVTGVAMAYLTVQMAFPRTLFFFTLEIVGALLFIAVMRILLARLIHESKLEAPEDCQYSG